MSIHEGIQSALNPHGAHAELAAEITWVLTVGAVLIFVLVLGITAYALFRRSRPAITVGEGPFIIAGGIVFPVVVLSALLIYTLVRAGPLTTNIEATPLRIQVTGEQWWWRVRYYDEGGRLDFETANEIHIPAGRPVEIALRSADVIHSFWVPTLAGKLDMIPGRVNRLTIMAKAPGVYRGQCAEYCGGPHAFMAFLVVATPPERYIEWAAFQREPRIPLRAERAEEGEALFLAHCSTCHTVRGTEASGVRGPDLTHVGSRRTIGAGLLPNNTGTIAAWIASSQQLKPGNLMPSFHHFSGAELTLLAAYLENLE